MDDPIEVEVELKLEFAPSDRERLVASPLLKGRGQRDPLRATYFDTPSFDLRRAGFALRIRIDGSARLQTVKSAGGASLLSRNEWESPVTGDKPVWDASAGPLLQHIPEDRLQAVAPIFATDVERTVYAVERPEATLIECAIDTGHISAGQQCLRVSEIEIELKTGSPQSLFDFARLLDAHVPLRLGVQSKSARGYALLEETPGAAVKATPIRLIPAMNAAEAFTAIAVNCIVQYRRNEAVLLDLNSPDAVHQARVGIRRLRSAFSLFAPLFTNDRQADHLKAELRWLAGEFGNIRDLDVLLPKLGDQDREKFAAIRERGFAHLHSLIEAGRVRLLPIDILEWLEVGEWRAAADPTRRDIDITSFAGERLDRMRKRIKRDSQDLSALTDEQRHEVRKAAKKLRYAAEFFVSLYPGRGPRRRIGSFLGHLETAQDALGRLNDDAAVEELLTLHSSDAAFPPLTAKKRRKLLDRAQQDFDDLVDSKRFWRT